MRKAFFAVFIFSASLAGCCSERLRAAGDGIEAATREVFIEYESYVDGDPRLDARSKEIRKNSVRKAREVIGQAKKGG